MMKKLSISLVFLAVLSAMTMAGCWHGQGPGCGAGGPSAMIDRETKDLNLTPAQQAQLDAIKKDIENDMKAHRDRMQAIHAEAAGMLAKDNPDINAIASGIKQKLSAEANPGAKMIDYFTKFYNTLDANQQKQVIEKLRSWSKDHPGKCHPWGFSKSGKCPQARTGCPMAGK